MEFHAVLLEGLFYLDENGVLQVRSDGGSIQSVETVLRPLVGEHIQLAVHHLPTGGVQPGAWGWGCCQWKPAECPAGHHNKPDFLFNFSGNGVLQQEPWRLNLFTGGSSEIDFAKMPGHLGRLAAATVPDVEKMRDSLASLKESGSGVMGVKVDELRDMVQRLAGDKKKK
jgi:hypothetical protein